MTKSVSRICDPAAWPLRWWLPLAAAVGAAGLWLDRPEPGPPPRLEAPPPVARAYAPPAPPTSGCGELDDGYARAACNAG